MTSLLILALLVTISNSSPARLEKREADECSLEYFGLESLLESLGSPEILQILRIFSSDMPWDEFETFSFRNTVLEFLDDNTSQNVINALLAMWSKEMETSIKENAGAPYVDNPLFERTYTEMANKMMFDETAKMSWQALHVFDKSNMEIHQCMVDDQHTMMKEMGESMKMNVLMMQGMAGAMVDWESIHQMLDCSEGYFNNNDTAIMKALHSIKVDPMECLAKARRLVDSLQRIAESSDLQMAPSILMEAGLNIVEAMNIDDLWSSVYNMVLHLRGHCLQTDWNSVATGVLEGCDEACKGYWKLTTGQWPEMEEYLHKLMTEMQKDSFWERLDNLYMMVMKEAKGMHTENQGMIMAMVHKQMMPMCTMMVNAIEQASNEIEPSLRELTKVMSMFPSYMIQEGIQGALKMIPHEIESFIFMLPSSNLVCYNTTSMIPMDDEMAPMDDSDMMAFFMAMENEMTEDDLMPIEDGMIKMQDMEKFMMGMNQTLCELFFADWPEGMIMPKGMDSMEKVLNDVLWKINTALVSPYCKHDPILAHSGSEYSDHDMAYPESGYSGSEYSDEAYPEPEPEVEN